MICYALPLNELIGVTKAHVIWAGLAHITCCLAQESNYC